MKSPPLAKNRLIETAIRLFGKHSFDGVGLSQLLKESDAPKGSFYHYFPDGKDELAKEVVLRSGQHISDLIVKSFNEATDFKEGLQSLINKIGEWFKSSDYTAGCPVSSVMFSRVPASNEITISTRAVFENWINTIIKHTPNDISDLSKREVAQLIVIGLEGAWTIARAQRNLDSFHTLNKTLLLLI